MKKSLLLLLLALFLLPATSFAQKASELKYVDAKDLMLINQGYDNTELYYSRLPIDKKSVTRKAVWELGLNSRPGHPFLDRQPHDRLPLDAAQSFHYASYGRHGHPGHRPLPAR